MEDKNIIYNKTNDNITPIDTSAKTLLLKLMQQMQEGKWKKEL